MGDKGQVSEGSVVAAECRPTNQVESSFPASPVPGDGRPCVRGKFIEVDNRKLYLRGVTYGPFRPNADGSAYPDQARVERDFRLMASQGINAVRTYTVPPRWLLDCARDTGLWVMVGLPWEQHVAFLNQRRLARKIRLRVREMVVSCAGHPAVLCFAIGNEVPSSIVRWHGQGQITHHIEALYQLAKAADPDALVTYVNYPSTEYLDLPFLDFVSFNVYLEKREALAAYLARLQNVALDRPLVLAEVGLDSQHHGVEQQAESLRWQIATTFAEGAAGVFVFAWSDEWHRSGQEIEDWDFGLTDRQGEAKPALTAVREAYSTVPFPLDSDWPSVSVVVCTHNGARLIEDCLASLERLVYPAFEVIVVNDGSTDATSELVKRHDDVELIELPGGGLSNARNTGLDAATGQIVAYIDDDVRVDPHWLLYLAYAFRDERLAAVGGPNINPPDSGVLSESVARSPGGPIHVLLTDRMAEHIPGCNMGFRRQALLALGGFDRQFCVAGDDVDVCWRLHESGETIGFHGGAMVWHLRRTSLRGYWRQQKEYGRAEALLQAKWPAKYNAAGQPSWLGRLYGNGRSHLLSWSRPRVYHGTWGTALFQSVYEPAPSHFWSLARMPEWYLLILLLLALAFLGIAWWPLHAALPLLIVALAPPLLQSALCASRERLEPNRYPSGIRARMRILIGLLHFLQPLARLVGRRGQALLPSQRQRYHGFAWPGPRTFTIWSETWRDPVSWLVALERGLQDAGAAVVRGGDFDRWDLEVRGGTLTGMRSRMVIEEHGGGRQVVRVRLWPRCHPGWVIANLFFIAGAIGAARDASWTGTAIFGLIGLLYGAASLRHWSSTSALWLKVLGQLQVDAEMTDRGPAPDPPADGHADKSSPQAPVVPRADGVVALRAAPLTFNRRVDRSRQGPGTRP